MALYIAMFTAGLLTIFLPCILPLVPIVLGVSIAGRSKLRPLYTILGMLVSFVGFTFLLFVVLDSFIEAADYIRLGTYYVLLLFGLGFFTHASWVRYGGTILGAPFFFWDKGPVSVAVAAGLGIIMMGLGGKIATRLQQFGTDIQSKARSEFGESSPMTTFIIGLTLGLVWVPCAGPALGLALTLVRDEPGLKAFALLSTYGIGSAIPLLLVGYGGQAIAHSVRSLTKFTGVIKQVAGILLILTAIALHNNWFTDLQVWLTERGFGNFGNMIEERLFNRDASSSHPMTSSLPKLSRAPEFTGLGTWHNGQPFTLAELKGKVVLVDFWTYSCINCIRTLPYLRQYWEKYGKVGPDGKIDLTATPFVLIGIHSPEFTFEKSDRNVADAIERYELTYPTAQDNDFATWRAFSNRYWPAKYLIDAEGYIRYEHFGEGEYEETDKAIAGLLQEAGMTMTDTKPITEETTKSRRDQTPETYLGERSWPTFGNGPKNPTTDQMTYTVPDSLTLHKYYLGGMWQLREQERQTLLSNEGEISMKFLGGEINLVLGLEEGSTPVKTDVLIDGKKVKSITIDRYDLFNLYTGEYGEHELQLQIHGKGVSAFAFTFGS